MALKSKEEKVNEQVSFDDLEYTAEYEEDIEYITISGKPQTDVSELEPMNIYDLDIGDIFDGRPEVVIWKNTDKKYDSLRLRIIDDDEYLDCYVNIPKRDKNGYIHNIRKSFDFYRTCFDFIYSILKYRDERNVVDSNGEEINKIKQANIETFAKYVDQMNRVWVQVSEGNVDSDYNSQIIHKMMME